jgi:RHS repeat-associated protein
MVTLTDAKGAVTRHEYNTTNQPIKTIDPNGNATAYAYDLAGNRVSATDANGNTTHYEYNAKGQPTKTRDALGAATTYTYGGSGCPTCGGGVDKLTALTDPNGNFTAYQYDTLGKLVRETDPLDNATTYTYDPKGNLISKTDANGNTIAYTYDTLGRLIKKSYPDASEETFTYDAKGNILTAANRNITYTFSYDQAGRMLSSGDSNGRTVSYDYDAAGRKTRLTYPDGFTVSYAYDATDRLSRLTTGDGQTYAFTYDILGRRTKLTYPNGTSAGYGYDPAGKLLTLTHKSAVGTTIDSFTYTHDKVGNRLSKKQPLYTTAYTYDAVHRLTRAKPSLPLEATEQYGYDPVGNRLSGPAPAMAYQYNQGNQLTEETTRPASFQAELFGTGAVPTGKVSYDYDGNGNLIKKAETTILPDKPLITLYSYDFENRLTRVEIRFGPATVTTTFSYDPLGRRIGKKTTGTAGPLNGTDTHTYLYDGPNILLEDRDTNILGADFSGTTRYLHGPGIDEPLSLTRNGATWYYHSDGLGSIVALSNNHGIAAEKYGYDAFGNRKPGIHLISQPYTYTGREWDKETGLYYYRARYYDPSVGRFISKDPIGFAGGDVNLYGYVSNNPVNWVDPWGLTANCPPHEDGIVSNNGFVRYGSNSIRRFFEKKYHCGFHCYLENRNEYCPKDPGAECCYDESKLLVTKGHRYAGCMGSNDDYRCNSISGCWNHNYNDRGGPNSSWGPLGESTSKRYNKDHQRQSNLPYIEPMAP